MSQYISNEHDLKVTPVAVIDLAPEELTKRAGIKFKKGDDPDVGPVIYSTGEWDGTPVDLVQYGIEPGTFVCAAAPSVVTPLAEGLGAYVTWSQGEDYDGAEKTAREAVAETMREGEAKGDEWPEGTYETLVKKLLALPSGLSASVAPDGSRPAK